MLNAHVAPNERHVGVPPQVVVTEASEDVRNLVADGQTVCGALQADGVRGVTCYTVELCIGTEALDVRHVDLVVEGDVLDEVDGLSEREALYGEHRAHHVLDGVARGLLRRALAVGRCDVPYTLKVGVDAHAPSARWRPPMLDALKDEPALRPCP